MNATIETVNLFSRPGASPGGGGPDPFIMGTRRGGRGAGFANYSDSHHRYRGDPISGWARDGGDLRDVPLEPGSGAELRSHVSAAIMGERDRLAREIHDTVAQAFSGILLHLEAAIGARKVGRHAYPEGLTRARELAKCGLEDTRRMLLNLRPAQLEGHTLSAALRQLAENFARDGQTDCTFEVNGRERELGPEIQDELFRMAQEALCNVRKHSHATCVSLSLDCGLASVVLSIRDDGRGLAPNARPAGGNGCGLPIMRERARRFGGNINVDTAPGTGTQIVVTMPRSGKPLVGGQVQ